ncbi:MAG: 5'-3' exonuclease [Chloroflexota bacterium]
MPARPLLLIDGDNLAHRAYHAIPGTVQGAGGRPANAILGFTSMLLALWDEQQPRAVFTAWDTLQVPTYRHQLWPRYQAGRVFDAELLEQLDLLPRLAVAFGFGSAKLAGYEADDLLASAVLAETSAGGSCLIVTNDRDAFQLVSDRVQVLLPRRGAGAALRVGPAEVVAQLGVLPEQVPDYKALAGDASDNIPGGRGIGPKTAARLLKRYGSLERALEAGAVAAGAAEQLRLFRHVVTMRADAAVALPAGAPNWVRGAEALRQLGLSAVAARVDQRATLRLPGLE